MNRLYYEVTGGYIIERDSNNRILHIYQVLNNTKAVLCKIAKGQGVTYSSGCNTRELGRKLIHKFAAGDNKSCCEVYYGDVPHYIAHCFNGTIFVFSLCTSSTSKLSPTVFPQNYTPSRIELLSYHALWHLLPNYRAQELALLNLFNKMPNNASMNDILVKSAALNQFYSTNVKHLFEMSNHILQLNIDNCLKCGCLGVVSKIAKLNTNKGLINYYSFATKYCSFHNAAKFPIYDSYVAKALYEINGVKSFQRPFKLIDLKDYYFFADTINKFQQRFNLSSFTYKDIDRYLWLLGKQYL